MPIHDNIDATNFELNTMSVQEPLAQHSTAAGTVVPQRRSSERMDRQAQPDRYSISSSLTEMKPVGFRANVGLENIARRTLGIFLLLVTVFLWTASNFLASVSSRRPHQTKLC